MAQKLGPPFSAHLLDDIGRDACTIQSCKALHIFKNVAIGLVQLGHQKIYQENAQHGDENGDRNEHGDVTPEIFVLARWEHSQGNLQQTCEPRAHTIEPFHMVIQ